jgi:hypothetical protein
VTRRSHARARCSLRVDIEPAIFETDRSKVSRIWLPDFRQVRRSPGNVGVDERAAVDQRPTTPRRAAWLRRHRRISRSHRFSAEDPSADPIENAFNTRDFAYSLALLSQQRRLALGGTVTASAVRREREALANQLSAQAIAPASAQPPFQEASWRTGDAIVVRAPLSHVHFKTSRLHLAGAGAETRAPA